MTGDPRTAALVALAAPSRPSLFFDAEPARSPWVTLRRHPQQGRHRGLADHRHRRRRRRRTSRRDFPDLVPEVPRAFERAVQGRLPLLRIGWGVIRPGSGRRRAPASARPSSA